jgi:hypothetical protein
MSTIVLRSVKGSPLTNTEVDNNFSNLNTDKYQSGGALGTPASGNFSTGTFTWPTFNQNTTGTAANVTGVVALANGGTGLTSFTAGQIHYGSFSTSANLFYDSANTRLGVGTSSPAVTAALVGTDAIMIPKGTTGEQPTGVAGYLRFNTTTTQFEGYNGTVWSSVGGAGITNDTSTATNVYPLFANATSGTALTVYTSNAKLLYKPSTGDLSSTAMVSNNGITINATAISSNYTIATGTNGFSVGPLTIASGVTITIASGQRHVII